MPYLSTLENAFKSPPIDEPEHSSLQTVLYWWDASETTRNPCCTCVLDERYSRSVCVFGRVCICERAIGCYAFRCVLDTATANSEKQSVRSSAHSASADNNSDNNK